MTLPGPAYAGLGIDKKACLRKTGRFRPASEVTSTYEDPHPVHPNPFRTMRARVKSTIAARDEQRAPRIPLAGFRNLTTPDRGMSTLFGPDAG